MARPKRKAAAAVQEVPQAIEKPNGAIKVRWTKHGAAKRAWLNDHMPAAGDVLETDAATAKLVIERGFAEQA